MVLSVPVNTSLIERLQLFEKYLDGKYSRLEVAFQENRHNAESKSRIKAERAQIAITREEFKLLFERELRS